LLGREAGLAGDEHVSRRAPAGLVPLRGDGLEVQGLPPDRPHDGCGFCLPVGRQAGLLQPSQALQERLDGLPPGEVLFHPGLGGQAGGIEALAGQVGRRGLLRREAVPGHRLEVVQRVEGRPRRQERLSRRRGAGPCEQRQQDE
jgi:hypothetical protein